MEEEMNLTGMEMFNRHYITVENYGRIIDGWSDGPNSEKDTTNAILINSQGGYQFRLEPDGEENPPLHTMDGIPLYKWDGESVQQRTEEEIKEDRAAIPAPPPSPIEQMRADLDYIAVMNGVTL